MDELYTIRCINKLDKVNSLLMDSDLREHELTWPIFCLDSN